MGPGGRAQAGGRSGLQAPAGGDLAPHSTSTLLPPPGRSQLDIYREISPAREVRRHALPCPGGEVIISRLIEILRHVQCRFPFLSMVVKGSCQQDQAPCVWMDGSCPYQLAFVQATTGKQPRGKRAATLTAGHPPPFPPYHALPPQAAAAKARGLPFGRSTLELGVGKFDVPRRQLNTRENNAWGQGMGSPWQPPARGAAREQDCEPPHPLWIVRKRRGHPAPGKAC